MRMCRKCSKQASSDSKICRDCGAILEDIPNDSVAKTEIEWEPASQVASSVAGESQAAGVVTADQPIVGEVVGEPKEPPPPETEAPAWKCPQCGETVPGTFDVCWKCLTAKDGEKPDQSEVEFLQKIADGSNSDEEPEPTELYAKVLGGEEDEGKRPQSTCPRCGSSKMMYGVMVQDQGDNSDGRLQVVVCGDPSALIFKDRLYGELKADICGDCGHVELRVANPEELYRHYRKAHG